MRYFKPTEEFWILEFRLGDALWAMAAEKTYENIRLNFAMTCVELALTAQLICFSDHTFVCTDNGSIAQLIGVSACTRRVPGRDLAVPVSTIGDGTSSHARAVTR